MTEADPPDTPRPPDDEVIRPPVARGAPPPSLTLENFVREHATLAVPTSPPVAAAPEAPEPAAAAEPPGVALEKGLAAIAGHFAPLERSPDQEEPSPILPPPGPSPAEQFWGGLRGAGAQGGQALLTVFGRLDVVVPALATLVGLIALGGAMLVDRAAAGRDSQLAGELTEIRSSLRTLAARENNVPSLPPANILADRERVAGALAELEQRLEALETQLGELSQTVASRPAAAAAGGAAVPVPDGAAALEGPTEDCIPLQTRFMVSVGDTYPICQTPAVVKVTDITADAVILQNVGPINAGGFARLGVANCTAMVFSTGIEGFAEMRVSC